MLGAIIGDIVGSRFEHNNHKETDFDFFTSECRFTDDTICTIAVADWCLNSCQDDLASIMQYWCRMYPNAGYGGTFIQWLQLTNPHPYNSWGNGSAMRVSPVGWLFESLEETLDYAKKSAEITHNHSEGIKGAQAVAATIFLARNGKSKANIRTFITQTFGYDLNTNCDQIRPYYQFDVSCQGSVPQAIIAFLDSQNFEDAIRLAVSLGGDSDTIAAITGSIAEAYYQEIPKEIVEKALDYLPEKLIKIVLSFPRYQ